MIVNISLQNTHTMYSENESRPVERPPHNEFVKWFYKKTILFWFV